MKRLMFCLMACLAVMLSSCGESHIIEVVPSDPNTEEVDTLSLVADKVIEVSNEIQPLFMQCTTVDELEKHLDEIIKMDGVEDAYISGNLLCVKIEGGYPLVWMYSTRASDTETESYSSSAIAKQEKQQTRAVSDTHKYLQGAKKICIMHQMSEDDRFKGDKKRYNELASKFEKYGFEVKKIDAPEFTRDFIKRTMPSYELIFFDTHGGYFDDMHWITTGERVDLTQKSEIRKYIKRGYTTITTIDEERGNTLTPTSYIIVSENYLRDSIATKFNNSIFFNGACKTLYHNESLADILLDLGVKNYLGYDDTNCESGKVGSDFFSRLLQGQTVGDAYSLLDKYDEKNGANLILMPASGADKNMCVVHPEPTTCNATNITSTSITLNGQIKNGRGYYAYGFCWGQHDKINIYNCESVIFENQGKEDSYTYQHQIECDDYSIKKIYFRSFVIFKDETVIYGDLKVFDIPRKKYPNESIIRDHLVRLYNSTNGAGWIENKNWCTDAPLSEWYGVDVWEAERDELEHYYRVDEGDLLFTLHLKNNNLDGFVDLQNCPYICGLYLSDNNLTFIDVSNCINLEEDIVEESQNLESINISGTQADLVVREREFPTLKSVKAEGLRGGNYISITSQNVSEFNITINDTAILNKDEYIEPEYHDFVSVYLENTSIPKLEIQNTVLLGTLKLRANQNLNSLVLNNLDFYYDKLHIEEHDNLKEVKFSNCSGLAKLFCTKNKSLEVLHVINCKDLKYLDCEENCLTDLQVLGLESLEFLWCSDNYLTELNVSDLPSLSSLACLHNRIVSVIPNKLKNIDFYYDQLYEYKYFSEDDIEKGWIKIRPSKYEGDYICYRKNQYGWYYTGEPNRGYHDETDDTYWMEH